MHMASARTRTAAHARTQAWRLDGLCIALRCVARHVLMYGTGRAVASCRARCNLHLRALVRVHVGVRIRMSTRFVRRDIAHAYRMAPLRLFGIDATCHCIDRCPSQRNAGSRLRPRPFGSGAVDTVRWLDSGHPNRRHVRSHVSECGAHRRHPAVALAVNQVLCSMFGGATSNVWCLLHVALLLCCMLRVGCCRGLDEYVRCMLQRCMLQPSAQL